MSAGHNGARFERQVATVLHRLGWFVTRSAGSHGPADLVALAADGETLFVQAKLGGPGRLSPREWNALYLEALGYGGTPLLAHRPTRGHVEFLRLLARKPETGVRGPAAPCEPWTPYPVERLEVP